MGFLANAIPVTIRGCYSSNKLPKASPLSLGVELCPHSVPPPINVAAGETGQGADLAEKQMGEIETVQFCQLFNPVCLWQQEAGSTSRLGDGDTA